MVTTITSVVVSDCAVICDIDHEEGDFSDYDSHINDADLTVAAGAALGGTNYGLSCAITDATAIYGQEALVQGLSNILRCRFYIDPNSAPLVDGELATALLIYKDATAMISSMLTYVTGTGYRIRVSYRGAAGPVNTALVTITDEPHYIELRTTRASADGVADGTLRWWVDGVEKTAAANVDNYDEFLGLNLVRLGLSWGGTWASSSGTIFLDELIITTNDNTIGPV